MLLSTDPAALNKAIYIVYNGDTCKCMYPPENISYYYINTFKLFKPAGTYNFKLNFMLPRFGVMFWTNHKQQYLCGVGRNFYHTPSLVNKVRQKQSTSSRPSYFLIIHFHMQFHFKTI